MRVGEKQVRVVGVSLGRLIFSKLFWFGNSSHFAEGFTAKVFAGKRRGLKMLEFVSGRIRLGTKTVNNVPRDRSLGIM